MKSLALIATLAPMISPLSAEQHHRHLGARTHGVSELGIAIEDNQIGIDPRVPGSDILGLEHAPQGDDQQAALSAAIAALQDPQGFFFMPQTAGCTVKSTDVDYDDAGVGDEQDPQTTGAHDGVHGRDRDWAQLVHSVFRASYILGCASPQEVVEMAFPYFDRFPPALALDVQLVSATGARKFEITRDASLLALQKGD